jgi:3-isopropylmalate/(R)-2-methylmalate dehydratase small subunit
MNPFTTHRGLIALIDRGNIDTDQIIPKQFLKSIKKTGFGEFLFDSWRYLENREPSPDFELNQPRYAGASILVAGNNFGCGSSREHAVWAIVQYGFRAVIAPRLNVEGTVIPGFADIFRNNSVKNGLLTIELDPDQIAIIKEALKQNERLEATIDLEAQTITLHEEGQKETMIEFDIDQGAKKRLTEGLDDIGLTLEQEDALAAFESKHNPQMYGD